MHGNKKRLVAIGVVGLSLFVAFPVAAPAAQPEALVNRMVRLVNELRVARGLNVLQVDASLQEGAERWSINMALRGAIFHNENLGDEIQGNWARVGENVGRGPSIDDIQVAFSTSPGHLDNLLDPRWDAMAVGVVKSSDGLLYITQRFEDVRVEAAATATPAPAPTATPVAARVVRRPRTTRR